MEHLVSLKNEQTARIVLRDTALYVFIGTIFAVHAAEGQSNNYENVVDAIRALSTLLSATMLSIYLSNDYYVSKIGDFVRTADDSNTFTRWEAHHRAGWRYKFQKHIRTALVFILFGGWTLYQTFHALLGSVFIIQALATISATLVVLQLIIYPKLVR